MTTSIVIGRAPGVTGCNQGCPEPAEVGVRLRYTFANFLTPCADIQNELSRPSGGNVQMFVGYVVSHSQTDEIINECLFSCCANIGDCIGIYSLNF